MNYKAPMNIVMASDQNYVPHMETLIVSIAENNKSVKKIVIHIFDNGISDSSKAWIRSLTQKYSNLAFEFYELTENQIDEMLGGSVGKDRSLSTYARLFIPKLITGDKTLYFDVDAVVASNLTELYETDMTGYAVAGVLDTNPITRHKNVGLKDTDLYVCAGMLLFNLEKCREINFSEQCVDFVRAHNGKVDAMDQGTINGVCGAQGLTKALHPKYDVLTSLYQLNSKQIKQFYSLREYYTDKKIREARNNPVFIHFTPNMTTRPWMEHCKHPMKNEYWKYRKMTEFSQYTLLKDNRTVKLRILGWFYRNSPSVYASITGVKRMCQK